MSLRRRLLALGAGLLLAASPAAADQTNPLLKLLFANLRASTDSAEAQTLEVAIWRLWLEHPDPAINLLMRQGLAARQSRDLEQALAIFDRVVTLAPDYAEGWNQRAMVHYQRGERRAAMRDIQRTLALEPRHFGALSGMALLFLQRGDEVWALKAYQEVLRIHPNAEGVRAQVEELQDSIRSRTI
ncbi:MAG TPA: tetratricopeptide repeat protein [Candidatus Competibacteraceae bacterium]|nr:tetratricopeptide repeat protein [Candidatus Competibacteraceae bacterium]